MPWTTEQAYRIVQEMERQSKKRRRHMLKEEREQAARENAARNQTASPKPAPSVKEQPSRAAANPQSSSGSMTEAELERWRRVVEANDDLLSGAAERLAKRRQTEEQVKKTTENKASQEPTVKEQPDRSGMGASNPRNSYGGRTEAEMQRWREIMDANEDSMLEILERRAKEREAKKTTEDKANQEPLPTVKEQPERSGMSVTSPRNSNGGMTEAELERWRRVVEANDDLLSEVGEMLLKEKQAKEAKSWTLKEAVEIAKAIDLYEADRRKKAEKEAKANAAKKVPGYVDDTRTTATTSDAAKPRKPYSDMTDAELLDRWREIMNVNEDIMGEVVERLLKEKQAKEAKEAKE